MSTQPARLTRSALFPLLLLYAGLVLVLQFRPIHDVDVFWQVRLGRLMLETGQLVDHEPFTATHGGEPMPVLYWLCQLLYAAAHRAGGWALLHRADALLFAGAFLVAGLSARRSPAPPGAVVVAVALAFMTALPLASLRPQSFAALAFAAVLLTAAADLSPARKLALAAVLLVLWQNLHPSVVVGAIVLAARAGAGWLRFLRDRRTGAPWTATALAALAALAMVATPLGFEIFRVAARNGLTCRHLGIPEWMPLWEARNWPASAPVWLALAASVPLLVRGSRRVPIEDLAAGALLALLTLTAYRFALFWALAMVAVWSRCFGPAAADPEPDPLRPSRSLLPGAAAVVVALLLPMVLRTRLFIDYLPLDGVAHLHGRDVHGVVYNHPAWGGPLIWEGHPDWRVVYDGRYYLFSDAEWDRYLAAAGGEVRLEEIEQRYAPAAFFLRPGAEAALIDRIRRSGRWDETYADTNCVVFLPRAVRTASR